MKTDIILQRGRDEPRIAGYRCIGLLTSTIWGDWADWVFACTDTGVPMAKQQKARIKSKRRGANKLTANKLAKRKKG